MHAFVRRREGGAAGYAVSEYKGGGEGYMGRSGAGEMLSQGEAVSFGDTTDVGIFNLQLIFGS